LTFIVTAVDTRLYCWLLDKSPLQQNPRLYQTHAADCHIETGIDIEGGSRAAAAGRYVAKFELISSESGQEWIRNCSHGHLVPTVATPGPGHLDTETPATPGPGKTAPGPTPSNFFSTVASTADAVSRGKAVIIGLVCASRAIYSVLLT